MVRRTILLGDLPDFAAMDDLRQRSERGIEREPDESWTMFVFCSIFEAWRYRQ